ncbi:MAG: NAD(P)/FAD-dependent oxidoreductase, partial [Cytophagaceae bacterium]|nr:NAD(P)/FAD-dependent oxidoreductase [Cytophagaceae bacterium]
MRSIDIDVLVIGAGPSGCVSASILHQSGLKVLVVEKEKFPRFVIGESLLPRCMETLETAGFLDTLKEKGFQQKFGAKFLRDGHICDFNFSDQFTKGWNWTWQVPRADFDLAISEELQKKGVQILFEHTVTGIEFKGSDSKTTITDKDGQQILVHAKFIVDSSGYGRVIPRLFNLDKPSNLPMRKTIFTH